MNLRGSSAMFFIKGLHCARVDVSSCVHVLGRVACRGGADDVRERGTAFMPPMAYRLPLSATAASSARLFLIGFCAPSGSVRCY